MRWYELILENAEDLARIMTAEQGKPLVEARGEVQFSASFVRRFAEEGRRVYGEVISTTDQNKRYLAIKQSVGVCAAITPWNFPLAMITRKVSPALAAGSTVVVKPAEQTPLTVLALLELAQRAGFPAGVLNIVTGDEAHSVAIGKTLCAGKTVRHLSFTGSTDVGRILAAQCAPTIKKLPLELGGNAPFLVFDDADLDAAFEGAVASKYRNAGQTCVCTNRIFAQEGIYEAFAEKLVTKVSGRVVGDGFQEGVVQGPMIDAQALDRLERHVAEAVSSGARLALGGKRKDGLFFEPTVLIDATNDMLCAQEEIFGPAVPVIRFSAEAEAIEMANNTDYGLAAYLYTRDISRSLRVSEQLEYGMVGINAGIIGTTETPFGGVKQAGLGLEGSRHGIDEYVEIKYLCIGGVE
ncbi:NAD-dependent succinate-semialdehyde dehydrogenase [Microbaculum sp. FT89]|uniref:NAD-dependent succinate-semialdehyde dehydrogenase n=1 Tax=Microbaculum sp. FT89 TaxID=3447298 RepID=UPI003F53E287